MPLFIPPWSAEWSCVPKGGSEFGIQVVRGVTSPEQEAAGRGEYNGHVQIGRCSRSV